MMLRLGLPALGLKLRLPTTPAAGGAGGSKNLNSFKPVKRRNPKGKHTPLDPNFDMVLRVRKAVDYTDVADVPKPGPPKFPRVEPANEQLSGAAATGPGTTLDTLDSKYEKDPEARERAIRLDVRQKNRPAMSQFLLEPNRGRRRTAVRFRSRRDARSADLTFFPISSSASFRVAGAPAHRPGPVERRVQEALEKAPRRSALEAGGQGCLRRRCDRAPRDGGGRTRRRPNDAKRSARGERRDHVLRTVPGGYDARDRSGGA